MRDQFRTAGGGAACGACLLGCLLLAAQTRSVAEDKPAAVRFAADFAADSRKDYQIQGEVAWRKGALDLGTKAWVDRPLPLGFTTEVRAAVAWSADENDRDLGLGLGGEERKGRVLLVLRRSGGKVKLVSLARKLALNSEPVTSQCHSRKSHVLRADPQ
jgi:hypothetical protein